MSNVRGVPAQELLENQAPEVLYNLNEQTGVKTPIERKEPVAEVVEEKPRRRKKAEPVEEVTDEPAAAEGEGE